MRTLSKGIRTVYEVEARTRLGAAITIRSVWARISLRADRVASEGEGACLLILKARSHLPLKLGWMTPRAGVKTTLASETRLQGLPVPSGGPIFLVFAFLPIFNSLI
jgi:hypothetical protein